MRAAKQSPNEWEKNIKQTSLDEPKPIKGESEVIAWQIDSTTRSEYIDQK
jgi:hypothetical protein